MSEIENAALNQSDAVRLLQDGEVDAVSGGVVSINHGPIVDGGLGSPIVWHGPIVGHPDPGPVGTDPLLGFK